MEKTWERNVITQHVKISLQIYPRTDSNVRHSKMYISTSKKETNPISKFLQNIDHTFPIHRKKNK